ncbi:alpha/beta fold hydrolase [Streptomyces sp. CA-181903]|uniref:alpha/beta fold hydrolase n=1 Tax=Streptomyces sp. CA-181903 TaxID=3240055 RepID=UPI003D8E4F7B
MSSIELPTPTPSLARITRGSGPGLLLAHGAGGGIQPNYGPIMDGLAEHFTVVGPDYPGTGRTPRSDEPLTLDGLADQLVAAAVAEGLETFAVTGYSLGAAVAVRAATRHPDRVTALVLTAGFARPNPRFSLATRLWRDLIEKTDDPAGITAFGALLGFGAPTADAFSQDDVDAMLAAGRDSVPRAPRTTSTSPTASTSSPTSRTSPSPPSSSPPPWTTWSPLPPPPTRRRNPRRPPRRTPHRPRAVHREPAGVAEPDGRLPDVRQVR